MFATNEQSLSKLSQQGNWEMNKKNAFFKGYMNECGGKLIKLNGWMALTSEWTVQSSGLGNKKIEQ